MLLRQTTWFSVDQLGQSAIQLALSVVLFRWLGASIYGTWIAIQALLGLCSMASPALAPGLSLLTQENIDPQRRGHLWLSAQVLAILVATSLLGILLVSGIWLLPDALRHSVLANTGSIAVLVFSSMIQVWASEGSHLACAQLRALDSYDKAARRTLVSRLAGALVMVAMVHWAPRLDLLMLASASSFVLQWLWQLSALQHDRQLYRSVPALRWNELFSVHWQQARWQWLKVLSGLAYGQLDRLLVAHFLGPASLALYAIVSQLANSLHRLVLILAQPMMLWSGRMRAARLSIRPLWRRFVLVEMAVLLAGAGSAVVGPAVLALWLGEVQEIHVSLLNWAILASTLSSLSALAHYLQIGGGHTRSLALASAAGAALSLSAMTLGASIGLWAMMASRCLYGLCLFGSWPALWRMSIDFRGARPELKP